MHLSLVTYPDVHRNPWHFWGGYMQYIAELELDFERNMTEFNRN